MKRLHIILLGAFLFLNVTNSHAELITKISFTGLTKTKESYLINQIKSAVGQEYQPEVVFEDEQIIRNLNLFFRVNSETVKNEATNGWEITFIVQEAKYLYPIFSVSGFKTQFKLQAGFNQINFRGKGENIGLVYQYYDRHSISGFYNVLRHSNGKTGHDIALTKYSTIEPLYFEDTTAEFNFDNYNVSLGGHYWLRKKLRLGLGGMYMYEEYKQLDSGAFDLGQIEFAFHKYQVRSFIEYDAINQDFEFQTGFRNRSYLETIQTIEDNAPSFVKFTNDIYWYKKIRQRGNLAVHNRIGISTNNFSPFSPFVLDGFVNVRGVGNRVSRGTAELITNIEYRHSIWRHKWFILQAVVFSDLGTLRQPGASIESMFNHRELNLFLGSGLRLHSQLFYKVIFRVDYSINPVNPNIHGFTFGVGQFF